MSGSFFPYLSLQFFCLMILLFFHKISIVLELRNHFISYSFALMLEFFELVILWSGDGATGFFYFGWWIEIIFMVDMKACMLLIR